MAGGPYDQPLNARWIARVGATPGCGTGRLPVNLDALLRGTEFDPHAGQSPAAFAAGRNFETACAGPTGSFAPLLQALVAADLDPGTGGVERYPDSLTDNRRARRTRERIRRMCQGDTTVVLIDQAALAFVFAGVTSFIRPDAVVIIPVGGRLYVVELKGFRLRAGNYPADKIAGALEQTAVYQIALRRIVADLGFSPALVADDAVIVCATGRGMQPVATVHANGDRVATLEIRLARAEAFLVASPPPAAVVAALPADATPEDRVAAFETLLATYGSDYRPTCMETCGGYVRCREAAYDAPARLGATRLLSGAGSIRRADAWSRGRAPDDPVDAPIAERLAEVRRLVDGARADAGIPAPQPRRAIARRRSAS
jgi:hypothetical protein